MACDPNTLLANAKAFQALSERDQMICITSLLCDISANSGGRSAGDYGGLTPTIVGTEGASTIDTSNGRVWWFYLGVWN